MQQHISVRVPWHDGKWNGTVCSDPLANSYCADYENIRRKKDVQAELAIAGRSWPDLSNLPPCARESGGFLSAEEWSVAFDHPYREIGKVSATHGHLRSTTRPVAPFTAHAVPFRWLSRENVDSWVQPKVVDTLPEEEDPPTDFPTSWVFSPLLQEAILNGFFDPVKAGESLVAFYTKSDHPVSDDVARLVVGFGDVASVGDIVYYDRPDGTRAYPVWDRTITHTLRLNGSGGFLVPYHSYLERTGDPHEDLRRRELVQEVVVQPESEHILDFSYRSEWISPDALVSTLIQSLTAVETIRRHGIVEGDWSATEAWLNERLGRAWTLRGPFPGIGAVLEAMGLRLGVSLVHALSSTVPLFGDDPWTVVGSVIAGNTPPPSRRFERDLADFRSVWLHLVDDAERTALARSLSRFALSSDQAKRWWDRDQRKKATGADLPDAAIVDNPYLVSELDRGGGGIDRAASFTTIDRGVLGEQPDPSNIGPSDRRRRRAALVSNLRWAESQGDTLLGIAEARSKVEAIPVGDPVALPDGWLQAENDFVSERVHVTLEDPGFVQLVERARVSGDLKRKLTARAMRALTSANEQWHGLLVETVRVSTDDPDGFDPDSERTALALEEQAQAAELILSRRLTCLVGRAGTGKTTVLGALSRAPSLAGRILFLAPTGKARVRLESKLATETAVLTVAQYLHQNHRYDGKRQTPLIGKPCYDGHETVIIDESSMLTEDDLAAVLATFTPSVKRLVLVGDPAQLPPIGPGRPFADLAAHLDPITDFEDEDPDEVELRRGALFRLSREVRHVHGAVSDTLRLASWFTDDKTEPDAEEIFNLLADGSGLNDLEVQFWRDESDLRALVTTALRDHLNVEGPEDLKGFNRSFLMEPFKSGWTTGDPAGAERWQLLSPVRAGPAGVGDLNRWIQGTWRAKALSAKRQYRGTFGPQEIIKHDKVILLKNGERDGYRYDGPNAGKFSTYLANGEVGLAKVDKSVKTSRGRRSVMNLIFAGRPKEESFGFWKSEFGGETGGGLIELAYALTVHKSQGSEFGLVIVALPRGRMAFRELIYTALTRSRQRLVLLVQGSDLSDLLELRRPEASDTIRRNTNIFRTAVRESSDRPYAHHLVHRAPDGTLVRSKSELIIYTRCLEAGLHPLYEQRYEGSDGRWKLPDFTFSDAAGEPLIWEHLGMLDDPGYRSSWERKLAWYEADGLLPGQNLFWTDERGGLDVADIDRVLVQVADRIV